METVDTDLVRTAMTDIVSREKEADMFRQTLVKICNIPMSRALQESLSCSAPPVSYPEAPRCQPLWYDNEIQMSHS